MSQISLSGVAITVGLALLLWATASVAVAARSLNRVQRRIWVTGGSEDALDEHSADAVEDAFIALTISRQVVLVLLAIDVVLAVIGAGLSGGTAVALSLLVFLLVDKLLPYWSVALIGPGRVLSGLRFALTLARLVFGLPARYLQRMARRTRTRHRHQNGEPERGVLGTFLDMAEEEGLVSESEEALLRGVADFEDATVREVMTPRVDIIAIDSDGSLQDLQALIAEHRFSRIPVMSGDLDHVIGVANLKDLVTALGQGTGQDALTSIVRPAHFVPETKKVSKLLTEFQRRHEQLAVVVDEYGGTAGLVTLEDVLEEIVGEIQDEDENEETLIEPSSEGLVASGKAEIWDVAEAIGVEVAEGEFHTVGGLVFSRLGRVPVAGESFDYGELRFDIVEADERRVQRVAVRRILTDEVGE